MSYNRFLLLNPENENLNQYWYSKDTIQTVIEEICEQNSSSNGFIAFISTPSLFFSMKDKSKSVLLDVSFIKFSFNL